MRAQLGRGLQADLDSRRAWVGNPAMRQEAGAGPTDELASQVESLESQGKSVVLVGQEKEILGLITIADILPPETALTLKALLALGVEQTVMLSGNNR